MNTKISEFMKAAEYLINIKNIKIVLFLRGINVKGIPV